MDTPDGVVPGLIPNCLHSPELSTTLITVSCLTDQDKHTLSFEGNRYFVYSISDGRCVATVAKTSAGLYRLLAWPMLSKEHALMAHAVIISLSKDLTASTYSQSTHVPTTPPQHRICLSYQIVHHLSLILSPYFLKILLFYFITKNSPDPHTSLLCFRHTRTFSARLWNQVPCLQKYRSSVDDIIGTHGKIEGQVGENRWCIYCIIYDPFLIIPLS